MRWRMIRVLFLAIWGVGISMAGARAEPSVESLEGFDALKILVGNTITATGVPGGDRVIYLGKDGTAQGLIDGRPEVGKWSFTDGKLCFVKGSSGRSECGTIKVSGSSGTFTIEGHDIALKIEPGNKVEPSRSTSSGGGGLSKLTGSKAAEAIVGNTIEGKIADKGQTTVFLDKSGAVIIRQEKDLLKGTWSVDRDTMCIEVKGRKDCFTVALDGTRVTWIPQKGGNQPLEFTLLKGNARNL